MPDVKLIPVFLASPSDVDVERAAVFEIVEAVNRRVGYRHGLRLDLYGWELEAPGAGRPQSRINDHVDEAELFIGVAWRRWGTPPGGEHSSGFEEEWQRAMDRRQREAGVPNVWLFFKEVDADLVRDPGPQLQRVLEFRARIEREHSALYHTFDQLGPWREALFGLLSEFLAERIGTAPTNEPERAPEGGGHLKAGGSGDPSDAATKQVVEALQAAKAAAVDSSADRQGPDLHQAARIFLAAFTWVSTRATGEPMGTHEVNFVYRFRSRTEPDVGERLELTRSMLAGPETRPGWYWLSGFEQQVGPHARSTAVLTVIASRDRNVEVRAAAIRALGEERLLADMDETAKQAIEAWAVDQDEAVRRATFDLLTTIDGPWAAGLLRSAAEATDSTTFVHVALLRSLLRWSPDEVPALLAQHDALPLAVDDEEFDAAAKRFTAAALMSMWGLNTSFLQEIVLRLDRIRDSIDVARVRAGLQSKMAFVQGEALLNALVAGVEVSGEDFDRIIPTVKTADADVLRRKFAELRTSAELRARLNWFLAYRHHDYAAWVTSGAEGALDRARRDLRDEFQTFRSDSRADLTTRFGDAANSLLHEHRYLGRDYRLAALEGIKIARDPADSGLVGELLDSEFPEVRLAALEALKARDPGAACDAAYRLLESIEGDVADVIGGRVTDMALELDDSRAGELLDLSHNDTAVAAIRAVTFDARTRDRLYGKLFADSIAIRAAAATRLGTALRGDELVEMLDRYLGSHRYYYNVVALLDRSLHGPERPAYS